MSPNAAPLRQPTRVQSTGDRMGGQDAVSGRLGRATTAVTTGTSEMEREPTVLPRLSGP
jgi:hypothetical protein